MTHDLRKPAAQRAVTAFCVACMGAAQRRGAYDCLCLTRLLYALESTQTDLAQKIKCSQ
jgi:hypothetical protein